MNEYRSTYTYVGETLLFAGKTVVLLASSPSLVRLKFTLLYEYRLTYSSTTVEKISMFAGKKLFYWRHRRPICLGWADCAAEVLHVRFHCVNGRACLLSWGGGGVCLSVCGPLIPLGHDGCAKRTCRCVPLYTHTHLAQSSPSCVCTSHDTFFRRNCCALCVAFVQGRRRSLFCFFASSPPSPSSPLLPSRYNLIFDSTCYMSE